jgi:O-acetyl-ADP-ribose deacetylase (regulator of RNase III)
MIIYKKGDLLKAEQSIIAHQCNMQGVMGSGVAKAIKEKYPDAFSVYRYQLSAGIVRLGDYCAVKISDKIIVNIFSQDKYTPRDIRHTSYDALEIAFRTLKSRYDGDIAMPKIGCGLGGGDWKIVSAIIESVFNDRDIYIYEL